MNEPLLVSEIDDAGLRWITLNRPDKANAIDTELCDILLAALEDASSDGTRVVILRANGAHYCGGFDLTDLSQASQGDLLLRFVRIEQALQLLWDAPFASIARVHCSAYGAGADLVAACTYRVGSRSCRFRFPGYRFGVALGTGRLAQLVGQQTARDMLLSNRIVNSEHARQCGLLTHLVDDHELDPTVSEIARQLVDLDQISLSTLLGNSRERPSAADMSLAALVRSLARPGLHNRIAGYRGTLNKAQKAQP